MNPLSVTAFAAVDSAGVNASADSLSPALVHAAKETNVNVAANLVSVRIVLV
ncbi:MAG TPA: hypothetical protein VJR92_01465 [Gemmatimonadaceae bacterium]|nr:hypothetical protein [Gemmatimonadaceae bacterium]